MSPPVLARTPLIALDQVVKVYRTGDLAVQVLHGISLTIQAGEFVAIMGASGSGKSTLMNILGCLDRPTAGRYAFRGLDVADLEPDEIARLRRDCFGFIFQSFNLITTATAVENVEVPAVYAGLPAEARDERAVALLTTLGLGDRLDHRPNQLSGGQQQRVAIARALMNGGQVIFADEPTGSLDSRSGAEVMTLLRTLNREGHTVVVITHEREVAEHADRLIEIKDGLVVDDSGTLPVPPAVPLGADATLATEPPAMAPLLAETGEALRMALRSLRVNLFRTVLTLLGIVIGVGSVIAMLAVGDGAKQSVLERISAMGTNLLLVRPGAPNVRGAGDVATLVPEDAEAIAALPNVAGAAPEQRDTAVLRYGSVDYRSQANGTTAVLPMVSDWPLASGTFISEQDLAQYAPVVVLGRTVVENLYPPGVDPVGTHLLLNNMLFLVVGTMSEKGATPFGSDQDDIVFVPLTTGSLRLFGERHLRAITVRVADVEQIDSTQDAVRQLLIRRHRTEDFRIRNMASILEAASETQGTLTVLLGSIAAISLLVGGIGVMNIMLVSVTERTREIGIRMATGARTTNILQQFMIEAVAVSALGGVIGVAGGLGVAWLLRSLGTPIVFSPLPVALAFGCAFLTGLVFGFMPARKAATLDPVVALGAE